MGWHRKILVIANVTATSTDLLAALKERASTDEIQVTVLVPALGVGGAGREKAFERREAALAQLVEAGIAADGMVGDADPVVAVSEAWDPRKFDEVIVCTMPGQWSKWLKVDLPHRVANITGVPVTHVIATDYRPPHHTEPVPEKERNALGPLGVMAWGGKKEKSRA